MELIKNIKKNTILLLFLTIIILYIILKDDLKEIILAIKNINYFYIIIAIILYFLSISINGYITYKSVNNKEKLSLKEAIKHKIITQFFNGITPFSSGGQPMEIYMLTQHGISSSKATSIIIQNFIFYQTALVIFGILAVIYNARFHIFVHNNTAVLHLEFVQQNIRRNSLFDEKYAVNIKICAVCKLNARYLAVTDNRSNS